MANYTTDPVTGILIPTPEADPGPDYADHISNALLTLAHLTHTGVANLDGYQIPSDGIDFNEDLSAQSHNLTSLRSTRYTSQVSTLGGVGDLNCVYFVNGNAYVNNGSGTPIQLTAGSTVNVVTSNNFTSLTLTANHTINAVDADVVFNYKSYTGAKILTLPLANAVQAGRFYFVKDQSGLAATYNITVNPSGSDTIDGGASSVLRFNFGALMVMSDGVSNWEVYYMSKPQDLYGAAVTITATSTSTTETANTTITKTAGTSMALNAGSTITLTPTTDLNINAGDDVSIYAADDLDISCGNNGGGISTANVLLSSTPTVGTVNITTGGTDSSITVQASGTGADVSVIAADKLTLTGKMYRPTKAVTSGTYTVDTTTNDYIIFVDPTSGAITINLPAADNGRVLTIKSVANSGTNNITLVRSGGDTIEAVSGNYVMDADYQSVTLAAYSGGSWFIIATA